MFGILRINESAVNSQSVLLTFTEKRASQYLHLCLILLYNSRPEVFYKKGVLKNLAKFTGKHLCQTLSLLKLQASHWLPSRHLYVES